MRQTITVQGNLSQVHVFVEQLKELGFNLLTKEVIIEADLTDVFVALEGSDQRDESAIVQTA